MSPEDEIEKIWKMVHTLDKNDTLTCNELKHLNEKVDGINQRMDSLKNMYNDHLRTEVANEFEAREGKQERKTRILLAIIAGAFAIVTVMLQLFL